MNLKPLLACASVATCLWGAGEFSSKPAQAFTPGAHCINPDKPKPVHVQLKPLADLLARGEGSYDSVNRGRAGDTPQGLARLTGKAYGKTTVREVISMQRGWLHAVGRYQFVPSTLRLAVELSSIDRDDYFSEETQDRLMASLILYKRPAIGGYVRGHHKHVGWALDELAKEWASVEYRNGRGYYDHVGGNRAHITRKEAWAVLQGIKKAWQPTPYLP